MAQLCSGSQRDQDRLICRGTHGSGRALSVPGAGLCITVAVAGARSPGPVDTGWMDDDIRAALRPEHPQRRLGEPQDIASVITFLVSPAGRWISGQLLHSDGGFSARF